MKTKQLVLNGMLAAVCAVLGYVALDMGNIKVTFESVPILLGALMFGPINGVAIGGIGTLVYQLLRYGVSVTTPLWILPYVVCGLVVGLYAKSKKFDMSKTEILVLVVVSELIVTVLNTVAIYVDSKIFGYYSAAYVFGALGVRFVICVVKAVVYGLVLPVIIKAVKQVINK